MAFRAIAILLMLSAIGSIAHARRTSRFHIPGLSLFRKPMPVRRYVIELPSDCALECERRVKTGAANAGCRRPAVRRLLGRIRHTRIGKFVTKHLGLDQGSRYLHLKCSEEGRFTTAKVLKFHLKKAAVSFIAVEEDKVMMGTAILPGRHRHKNKSEKLEWNIDEADSENNGQRCTSSKLGEGSTVLVLDTGCKPLNSDYCESFLHGKHEKDKCGDLNGHGSHVAGTVGDRVWGVAPNASVGCSRVLDENNKGSLSSIIEAIEDAVQYSKTLTRPLIINLSLGGLKSDILNHAVRDASLKGLYFAIASGNDGIDAKYFSPASVASANLTRIFVVGAHDEHGKVADFTNYGKEVTISAGGVDIKSTASDGGVKTDSGTSMASPAVAGAMAVLQSDGKNITHNTLVTTKRSVVYKDGNEVDILSYQC